MKELTEQAMGGTPECPTFNPNREYKPFDRFQHNGIVAECRKVGLFIPCRDCAIYPCLDGYTKCMSFCRYDKTNVYYKIVDL